MGLNPTHARQLMEGVAHAKTRPKMGEAAAVLLNFLLRQLEELRDLSNDYPRNAIRGDVWFDGRALTELCDELTGLLSRFKLPEQEELASRLAVGMACQVMGHYPEQIFPRVLRNARCKEAISEADEAVDLYEAIVDDFKTMELDELLHEEPMEASSRVILESLDSALERLCERRPEQLAAHESLRAQLRKILG